MYHLIASVCLLSSPYNCKDVDIALEAMVSPHPAMCAFAGQTELAKWIGENPQWRVDRFKCVQVNKSQQDA